MKWWKVLVIVLVSIVCIISIVFVGLNFFQIHENSKKSSMKSDALQFIILFLNKNASVNNGFYESACYEIDGTTYLEIDYSMYDNAKNYKGSVYVDDSGAEKHMIWLSDGNYYLTGTLQNDNIKIEQYTQDAPVNCNK